MVQIWCNSPMYTLICSRVLSGEHQTIVVGVHTAMLGGFVNKVQTVFCPKQCGKGMEVSRRLCI